MIQKPSKVSQYELRFGMISGLVSRSAYTRLQVSVCSGYDLCHRG